MGAAAGLPLRVGLGSFSQGHDIDADVWQTWAPLLDFQINDGSYCTVRNLAAQLSISLLVRIILLLCCVYPERSQGRQVRVQGRPRAVYAHELDDAGLRAGLNNPELRAPSL